LHLDQNIAFINFSLRFFFWFLAGIYYQKVLFKDVQFFSLKYLGTFIFGPALASIIFSQIFELIGLFLAKLIADVISSLLSYFVISRNYIKK
jgi:hypothetical protein